MEFSKKQMDIKVKELVEDEAFKFKLEAGGYSFTKKQDLLEFKIVIGYSGYPGMYKLSFPSAYILFRDVEDILQTAVNFCLEYPYNTGNTIKNYTIHESINYQAFEKAIHLESDFDNLGIQLRKAIEIGAYLFFDEFDNLNKVFKISEKMELKEAMNFILQPLPFRRFIIKGLNDFESYTNYYHLLLDVYTTESNLTNLVLINKIKELIDEKMNYL